MNKVIVSGLLKGQVSDTGKFSLVQKEKEGFKEFSCSAYGAVAEDVKKYESGTRLILECRVGSEKDADVEKLYHTVLIVNNVINDKDYSLAVVSGENRDVKRRTTKTGKELTDITLLNSVVIPSKDETKEDMTFNTYVRSTSWFDVPGDVTSFPNLVAVGVINPNSYEIKTETKFVHYK